MCIGVCVSEQEACSEEVRGDCLFQGFGERVVERRWELEAVRGQRESTRGEEEG